LYFFVFKHAQLKGSRKETVVRVFVRFSYSAVARVNHIRVL